jgi:hypothetical protein
MEVTKRLKPSTSITGRPPGSAGEAVKVRHLRRSPIAETSDREPPRTRKEV